MSNIIFYKTHFDEKEYENINIQAVISVKENKNGYNADVKVIGEIDWITLDISYSDFIKVNPIAAN